MSKTSVLNVVGSTRIPQTKEEASALLKQFGDLSRQVEALETQMNDALAAAKAEFENTARPIAQQADLLVGALKAFCEAHRAELTNNNKTKTVNLGTGKVAWRTQNASVKVDDAVDVEVIIKRIEDAGEQYESFLRSSKKLDKVAMVRNPNLANKIEGIKVQSAGEKFVVEPFAQEQIAESA